MSSAQGKGVEISIGSSSDFVSPRLPVSLSQGRSPSSSLSPRLTVRITREGWAWLVLAGILWGTGLYKGINLLSFLGLLMLAAWMIQWLGARRRLSHLALRRWTDNLVFAETPFTLTVEVSMYAVNTHEYCVIPPRSETTFGSAVATIVWSSAASSSVTISPR